MPATMFTGTATSMLDMRNKLKEHLTDASLGEHQWTVMKETPDELYLKGPGSPGLVSDDLYVQLKNDINAPAQEFCWQLRGAYYFDGARDFENQPGVTPASCSFQLAQETTIKYWLWVNGSHFKMITKIGQFYLSLYCGYLIRYGTPDEIPYPLVIAGSSAVRRNYVSIDTYYVSNFWQPCSYDGSDIFGTNNGYAASMYYHNTDRWIKCSNQGSTTQNATPYLGKVWPNYAKRDMGRSQSNQYVLLPLILNNYTPNSSPATGNLFGEFDEVYWVSGFQLTPESTIMINGKQYICFPNHTHAGVGDFVTIPLG